MFLIEGNIEVLGTEVVTKVFKHKTLAFKLLCKTGGY